MPTISKTELIKLQKVLKTDDAIGKKFDITRQAIHQLRKKYGIPSNLTKNDERNEKILSLYKNGTSVVNIAKKTGLSVSQTYRLINNSQKKKPAKKKKR